MGYHVLPSYTHYWSSEPDLGVEIVAPTMTKSRFQALLSNLHLNNEANATENDKLWKLRPLIDRLNLNFGKLYNANQCQSIDESMILFKRRSTLKQYCPMKPIKRGYKLWVRADTSGYISKFCVYQGKSIKSYGQFPATFGLGESVVASLCHDIFQKGHKIFFDNFFTSLPLLSLLKEKDTFGCGTIRANRKGLPAGMKTDKQLQRGDYYPKGWHKRASSLS
ncbi:PiggyBac transposable element-derived protein 4 [Plakobranchus ocellatus]|uniref:PiggyBac transposable element-derived protein 4 n=1 Tax=Plakobranchus ocellatus TaxID=259542 RepID=A0AAV4ANC3_9GAST|nr:PiggyBac transposable element-derived protein 4 [Plakobranchus ocellatus]